MPFTQEDYALIDEETRKEIEEECNSPEFKEWTKRVSKEYTQEAKDAILEIFELARKNNIVAIFDPSSRLEPDELEALGLTQEDEDRQIAKQNARPIMERIQEFRTEVLASIESNRKERQKHTSL